MKKTMSLIGILLLYVAAFALGALTVVILKPYISDVLLLLFIGDVIATIVVYLFGVIIKNSSAYDPYWSVQPLCLCLGFYLLTGAPFMAYQLFALIPLTLWAARLTYNWAKGFSDFKWQDWRYVMFKEKSGKLWQIVNFFGINVMPTVLVFCGTIPILQYIQAGSFNIALSIIGCAVSTIAFVLQFTADIQLSNFKKTNAGICIDSGLWRYSRHPNYLGEVSLWWGFFIAAIPAFTWISVIGAAAITLLFVFISIPMMEKRMINREGYAEYKKRVSMLLILPRKKTLL